MSENLHRLSVLSRLLSRRLSFLNIFLSRDLESGLQTTLLGPLERYVGTELLGGTPLTSGNAVGRSGWLEAPVGSRPTATMASVMVRSRVSRRMTREITRAGHDARHAHDARL